MIESATVEDVAAIVALEADCLGEDAWSEPLVRDGVTGGVPTVHYLAARVDDAAGDVVGHAVVSVVDDFAELQRIAVEPARRRTGLATALLAAVVERARLGGADRLLLEVRDDNTGARAFYAARGFTEIDRRPRYYRDGATAVVMSLPLVDRTGPEVKVCRTR